MKWGGKAVQLARNAATASTAVRTLVVTAGQSLAFTAASVISFEPMPAATTPAPNHLAMLAGSGSTPPVGMILVQGMGPSTALTKSGPPTLAPGNSLTMSQPISCARMISVTEPQPGK